MRELTSLEEKWVEQVGLTPETVDNLLECQLNYKKIGMDRTLEQVYLIEYNEDPTD